jgi:K+-sensing histidine kinase KdpD
MIVAIYTSRSRFDFGAHRSLCACAVVLTTVGCAVVATLGLGSALKHTPTLFFCSVILSSWFGGVWSGFFAVLFSAIALDYYFIPPINASNDTEYFAD